MKNLIACLGFILITNSFLSQIPEYFPDGAEWRIRITNAGNYPYMFFQDDFVYYISGDTTIGAYTYRKIFVRGIYTEEYLIPPEPTVYTHYDQLKGLLRQEGRKIYIGTNSQQQFIDTLLYDFDLAVGDLLPETWNQSYHGYTVLGQDSIWVDGSYRKKYRIELAGFENSYDSVLVEGIGHSGGLFENFIAPWSHTNRLMCYAIDHMSMYQGPFEPQEELCVFNLGIPDNVLSNVTVFPNPTDHELHIRSKESEQIRSFEITDLLSNKSTVPPAIYLPNGDIQADVSVLKPGIYLLNVQTVSGKQSALRFVKE